MLLVEAMLFQVCLLLAEIDNFYPFLLLVEHLNFIWEVAQLTNILDGTSEHLHWFNMLDCLTAAILIVVRTASLMESSASG